VLTEGVEVVPAVVDPGAGVSKAATTPTMDLASISPPTIHNQIGSFFLGGEPSTGRRRAVRAGGVTGVDGATFLGWRRAVQARPFQ
jgi:hypothetical protein